MVGSSFIGLFGSHADGVSCSHILGNGLDEAAVAELGLLPDGVAGSAVWFRDAGEEEPDQTIGDREVCLACGVEASEFFHCPVEASGDGLLGPLQCAFAGLQFVGNGSTDEGVGGGEASLAGGFANLAEEFGRELHFQAQVSGCFLLFCGCRHVSYVLLACTVWLGYSKQS